MITVPLRFLGTSRTARMRDLTGRDEYGVSDASTATAIALVDTLLDDGRDGQRIHGRELVAADRDRLLAAVYAGAFGDRVESTLSCSRCSQPFDLHFSLGGLIASVDERTPSGTWKALSDGRFEGADGVTIRLPTGDDELAVAALPPEEVEPVLRGRGEWPDDELLDQVAPLLDLELVARCAECGHVHNVRFDIQSYLLAAIAGERRRLLAEINRIAVAYGWPLGEILSLSRTDRRTFVELIENEQAAS
jgi:hypothetical protein